MKQSFQYLFEELSLYFSFYITCSRFDGGNGFVFFFLHFNFYCIRWKLKTGNMGRDKYEVQQRNLSRDVAAIW